MTSEPAAEPCPRCGQPFPEGANFCPNCGAPVAMPAASERRVVTVVFADLAGSTELAAMLDPERFRDVLAAFHGMVSDEITALGGRAEGFIGDAVLGVFGMPVSHDDDAVRGVRAGLAIVDRAGRIGARLELPVPVGVPRRREHRPGRGRHSHRPKHRHRRRGEYRCTSAAGRRCRARCSWARRRVCWSGTRSSSANVARSKPRGSMRRSPAWQALGAVGPHDAPVDPARQPTPRDGAARRHVRAGRVRERAHLVTLLGEPGIGKTRVVEEFLAGLPEGVAVLVGRSSVFEEEVDVLAARSDGLPRDRDRPRGARGPRARAAARGRGRVGRPRRCRRGRSTARPGARHRTKTRTTRSSRYHAAEVRRGCCALLAGLASTRSRRARLRGSARGRPALARPDRAARQGSAQGAAAGALRRAVGVP